MKHLKFLFLFIGLTLFVSCGDSDSEQDIAADNNRVVFLGTIGSLQSRAADTSWDEGDEIGIYALNAGAKLSETAIFDGKANVRYRTDGKGEFTAVAAPITFPSEGDLDFVAYYPYQSTITDYKYNIDVSTQSNPAAIDLLYSNNATRQNRSNDQVNLNFRHMLSMVMFNLKAGDDVPSLDGLTASLKNVVVDGELALADGAVSIGNNRKEIIPVVAIANDNKTAVVKAIVMPGQNMKDVEVVFNLDGNKYEWTPEAEVLNETTKYSYTLTLVKDESGIPTLIPADINATISDWKDPKIEDTPIILNPEEEEEAPGEDAPYYPADEARRIEVPRLSEDVENNKAQFVYHYAKDNVGDKTLNYSLEYNYAAHHSRWVAFTFYDKTAEVNTKRSDAWAIDPFLQEWTDNFSDYRGSGYDRGHLVASSDRLYSVSANEQTFYFSNMSPQIPNLNSGIWNELERKVQGWGNLSAIRDTLYVVKGGTIRDDQIMDQTIGDNKIVIPKYYFMALLAQKGDSYKSIAFLIEHKSYSSPYDLTKHVLSVGELEEKTGIDFFHNLPDSIENVVEKQKNISDWPDL